MLSTDELAAKDTGVHLALFGPSTARTTCGVGILGDRKTAHDWRAQARGALPVPSAVPIDADTPASGRGSGKGRCSVMGRPLVRKHCSARSTAQHVTVGIGFEHGVISALPSCVAQSKKSLRRRRLIAWSLAFTVLASAHAG